MLLMNSLWIFGHVLTLGLLPMYGAVMPQTLRQQLLDEVELFLLQHNMSASALGLEFANDAHLVRRLRNGQTIWLDTADRLRDFLKSETLKRAKAKAKSGASA